MTRPPPPPHAARARRTALAALVAAAPLLAAAGAAAAPTAPAAPAAPVGPSFHKSRLPNGLTVIVHEDHTLPEVAVNLLYRVGSRDEIRGRTGFAHLFEHLMFMGTRRAPTKMFDAWMEAAGGSNNAWTSQDYTDYHETSPPGALPLLLWLEADRLETLGREVDKPKLDLQRDVVRNERRQVVENTPYGKVELRLPELLYPKGHPYHHPVIGSHEDLEAASVEDVRSFFTTYYSPANASLVVAGDVKRADAEALAAKYFGHLPGGGYPATRAKAGPPARPGRVVRETLEDRVELTKIVMAFSSPPVFEPGDAELDLLAGVLARGKASRLYKALVYDRELAQSVQASQDSQDLASAFVVEIVVRPGVSPDDVEKAADRVLEEAARVAPSESELRRAKNVHEFRFLQGLQSLAQRASLLNQYEAKRGDPGYFERDLARYREATSDAVLQAARSTLTLGERVVLRVVPAGGAKKEGAK
ncbi:MAG TPA: pitrilysin family protein [Polyangiaceae bacterium]|nr:pitrilysin family protein [Polyangiaceae bacterium]